MSSRRLALVLAVVALGVTGWTALALGARASYGNRTTGDEPHYLLTAQSLADDGDLDVADEIAAREYTPYHEQTLRNQARPLPDGRMVEPHDPLLPVLLALPVAIGGWIAGKLMLSVVAGVLAATLVWTAVRRFGVGEGLACLVVAGFAVVMPWSAYANQVYPELPAALAVAGAAAALLGPMRRAGVASWLLALVALPWLSVKYAPVTVALACIGAVVLWRRGARRTLVLSAAVLAVAAVSYLAAHQALYGGWTVYASGSHFAEGGELSVMGYEANYPGRAIRLIGLLVDRNFGLAAWAPAYLLAVPAFVALARVRPHGWLVLSLPLLAGWLNATFVAQTMHGWWSPGRQVVVVTPLIVLAVAWWIQRARIAAVPFAIATVFGVVAWMWVAVESSNGSRTLVVDFFETSNPAYRAWSSLLPDGGLGSAVDVAGFVCWGLVLALLAVGGWRSVRPSAERTTGSLVPNVHPRKEPPCPEPDRSTAASYA